MNADQQEDLKDGLSLTELFEKGEGLTYKYVVHLHYIKKRKSVLIFHLLCHFLC